MTSETFNKYSSDVILFLYIPSTTFIYDNVLYYNEVKMVKIHKNDYTLKELVELDQDDHYTVSETPLGAEEGKVTRYVKKAVDWTGVDGDGAFSGDAEAKERLRRRLPAATFAALKKLAQNSKANSGSRGTVLVRYPDGVKRVMSYKNWKAIEDAGLDGKNIRKIVDL